MESRTPNRHDFAARSRDLHSALNAVLAGDATEADRSLVRAELLAGRIVHVTGDRNVAIGGDAPGAIIITGDGAKVTIQATPEQVVSMREQILPTPRGIVPALPNLVFVGRQGAVDDVKKLVTGAGRETLGLASIVVRGWPGVGKTTLTNVLAHDPDFARTYTDGVLWTSLDQKPDLTAVLSGWGRALGRENLLRVPTAEEMAAHLGAVVHGKRMLLIVDDVWEAEHGAVFQRIKGQDCGLLFTTREHRVAEKLALPENIYALPVLSHEDGLALLKILAPEVALRYVRECEQLVEDLECLPLALQVAGRLLHSEQRLGWGIHELLADIRAGATLIHADAPADRAERGASPTVSALLRKSTDRLDIETRGYFAMLGVFAAKPATFDLNALRRIWRVNDPKPFVRELTGRGLLEPVEPGRFQIHALLKAHARSLLASR